MKYARIGLVMAAALSLASCLMPGKFTSTLDIRKDRSFTFTYVGEVHALEENAAASMNSPEGKPALNPAQRAAAAANTESERRAIAEALAKEAGYQSVRYVGGGKFLVDYTAGGRLDRGFLYPFNSDAEAVIPWIAIEVRKDGSARMKAPAFGDEGALTPSIPGLGATGGPKGQREGIFTLTTDAEIVMHNVEEGVSPGPEKKLVWRVMPNSKSVPTAVVRFGV